MAVNSLLWTAVTQHVYSLKNLPTVIIKLCQLYWMYSMTQENKTRLVSAFFWSLYVVFWTLVVGVYVACIKHFQHACTANIFAPPLTVATGSYWVFQLSSTKYASNLALFLEETCSSKLQSDTGAVCRYIVTLAIPCIYYIPSPYLCFYFRIREGMNILSIKFILLNMKQNCWMQVGREKL